MKATEKYDKLLIGLVSGFLLPLLAGLIIFAFTAHGKSIPEYLTRMYYEDTLTKGITLCVFSNVLIFFIFNRFDMLRAARGVLASTIFWAIMLFVVKFFIR